MGNRMCIYYLSGVKSLPEPNPTFIHCLWQINICRHFTMTLTEWKSVFLFACVPPHPPKCVTLEGDWERLLFSLSLSFKHTHTYTHTCTHSFFIFISTLLFCHSLLFHSASSFLFHFAVIFETGDMKSSRECHGTILGVGAYGRHEGGRRVFLFIRVCYTLRLTKQTAWAFSCVRIRTSAEFIIIIIITAVTPSDPQTQIRSKPKLCAFKVVTLRGLEQFLPPVIPFFLPSTVFWTLSGSWWQCSKTEAVVLRKSLYGCLWHTLVWTLDLLIAYTFMHSHL